MGLLYRQDNQEITVTGYEGEVRHLLIPEEAEGLPVRRIAHSAFAHRMDLVYVRLPAALWYLERFAFYGCRNLGHLCLHDGIREYFDGVTGQCVSLKEIELELSGGGYTVLRDMLADNDRTVRFSLNLPDGTARLTFPDYLAEYQEDTRARAIHMHIEGAGFTYRECVSRSAIDFRGYDRLFDRVRYNQSELAVRIALDRLCFPYHLESPAQAQYEAFVRENAAFALREVIRLQETVWLTYLSGQKLLPTDVVQEGIRLASGQGMTEYVSILMASQQAGPRPGRRMEL